MIKKPDLVERVAVHSGLSKAAATQALDATLSIIEKALNRSEQVRISQFGTFSLKTRAERDGKNPRTGETVRLPARRQVKFKPATMLKAAVAGKDVSG
jgi:DNA-binding protein HU-beta